LSVSGRLLRTNEWLLVAYFALASARAAFRGQVSHALVDLSAPLIFVVLGLVERRIPRLWVGIVRDWVTMPFLLLAYWNVDWLVSPHQSYDFERRWVALDRILLEYGRGIIESCGAWLPAVLEICYTALWVLAPVLLGVLYMCRRWKESERFLFTLFAGTMLSYALLPMFPSIPPRVVFPSLDLPAALTVFRRFNIWVLDNGDIRSSIFPSGHVTVAFSAAFAIRRVFSDRPWFGRLLLVFATLVAINTVYGRYHYAVDGIAGFFASLVGLALSRVLDRERAESPEPVSDLVKELSAP